MVSQTKGIRSKLIKGETTIGFILYMNGLAYAYIILHWSIDQKTHFSENALLPGLVDEQFPYENDVYNNFHLLKSFFGQAENESLTQFALKYLRGKFESNGLETYVQKFTFEKGLFNSELLTGSNIIGISRSSRGYSNEALVVALSYSTQKLAALALVLSLAKFCTEQVYWAKDIIFVLVEHEEIGMLAWLNAYHERNNTLLRSAELSAHSGSIHAAVVLDLDKFITDPMSISRADLKINMLNGQLPNLDFVNLAVRLLEKHGFLPTIYGQEDSWSSDINSVLWHHAKTASLALITQSDSRPNGLHSLFGSFGIEALTVKLGFSRWDRRIPLSRMALVLEGILRSLNNLLERFHASYFFYILFSTHSFISISIYMPFIGVILAALLVKVIDYSYTCSVVFLSHCLGLILYMLPELLEFSSANVLKQYLVPVCISSVLIVVTVLRLAYFKPSYTAENSSSTATLLFGLAIIEVALFLSVVSLLNFGLAFNLCGLTVPLVLALKPSLNRVRRLVNSTLALLLNPFVFVTLFWYCYGAYTKQDENHQIYWESVYDSLNTFIVKLVVDCYLFSSWHYTLLTVSLIPTWIILWISITVT